jgi:transcriptional regulator with XRE-family HTH domain
LSNAEKIDLILKKRNITYTELADRLGISKQNLYKKLRRRSIPENELIEIAELLNCTYESSFTLNDTGEKI